MLLNPNLQFFLHGLDQQQSDSFPGRAPNIHCSRTGDNGFTFVEIILVVVLMSVVMALVIPSFSQSHEKLQLKTCVRDLANLMRYAKDRAVIRKCPGRIIFSEDFSSYALYERCPAEDDEATPPPDNVQRISGRWGRTVRIPNGLTVASPSSQVEFDPDGRIEKTRITVCRQDDCLTLSTREYRGRVITFEHKRQEDDAAEEQNQAQDRE